MSAAQSGAAWRLAAPPQIDVPSTTGVDVQVVLAGPGARSIAFVLDFMIRSAAAITWFVLGTWIINGDFTFSVSAGSETLHELAVVRPTLAIYFLYHMILEPVMRGRTPGKRMIGLRIVTTEGLVPSTGALVTRNAFRLIDSLPLAYVVGLLCTMFGRQHLRLGDIAAGTVLAVDRAPFLEKLAASRPAGAASDPWIESRRRLIALSKRGGGVDEVLGSVEEYRRAAHELGVARGAAPSSAHTLQSAEYLEAAYADLHDMIHRPARRGGLVLLALFRGRIPEALHAMRVHLFAVTLLFVVATVAGMWLVYSYPDLVGLFASPQMIATVERGELWTDGMLNVTPSAILSVSILTNNIVVAFTTFCAGLLFGLGTFYLIGLNGLSLGALFALTAQHGLGGRLFDFVIAHGCVELSCICIAGAAGSYMGEALIRPGARTRAEAFRLAAIQGIRVLAVVIVLLLICGLIEGYISPDPEVPRWARVTIGVGYWLFMVSLLRGYVFGRSRGGPTITA